MSSKPEDDFSGIFIEITTDMDGSLIFGGGWVFEDDDPDDYVEYMHDLLAGIYGIISTQHDNVISAGRIVRAAPGFRGFDADPDPDMEIVFEPDDELLERVSEQGEQGDSKVVDFKKAKFDPKKHRKH